MIAIQIKSFYRERIIMIVLPWRKFKDCRICLWLMRAWVRIAFAAIFCWHTLRLI